MSWITVDTGLHNHPKMAALSSDTARWGWIVTLLEAKDQRRPGDFANAQHFRHVLGRLGRYLSEYIKVGLMDQDEDGALHVHDWKRHQWAVAKAEQRETSRGHQEDNDETFEGQKEDVSRAVRVSVLVGNTEGVQGKPPDPADAYWTLTGRYPSGTPLSWIDDMSAQFGPEAVVRALAKAHANDPHANTLLGRTQDILRAEARALSVKEQTAERERQAERRPTERTPEQKAAIAAELHRMMEEVAA